MGKFFNSISKMVVESYNNISDKAEEVTKIGRVKIEIIATKRDIEKLFVELGGRFYNDFGNNSTAIYKDKEIKNLIAQIKEKEEHLEFLNNKIDKIKKEDGIDLQ
jgi:predicted RNase H-like nuclease (RuvC/YqgF family)